MDVQAANACYIRLFSFVPVEAVVVVLMQCLRAKNLPP